MVNGAPGSENEPIFFTGEGLKSELQKHGLDTQLGYSTGLVAAFKQA